MPVDADIGEYLEDLTRGTVGTDIFIGYMPPTPDDIVVVRATAGRPPHVVADLEQAGFQITVRNADHDTGHALAMTIRDDLHQLTHATIETRSYKRIDAVGSVTLIGRDELERTLWSVNFIAQKPVG